MRARRISDDDVARFLSDYLLQRRPKGNEGCARLSVDGETILFVRFALDEPDEPTENGQPDSDRIKPVQLDIITVIESAGRRLVTTDLLAALDKAGKQWGQSTIVMALAEMVRLRLLTSRLPKDRDQYGHGYGLAHWG